MPTHSIAELKALFRRNFPVVPGGPATGRVRSAGAIEALDALAEAVGAFLPPTTRRWTALTSDWRLGELVVYELNGQDQFVTIKAAGVGVPIPQPTGVEDAYSRPAAAPAPVGGGSFASLTGQPQQNAALMPYLGAPQWVAGPQKAGALVYDAGLVYRVKSELANSQSAPAGNAANYEPVGAGQATPTQRGTARLYPTLGQNTDGAPSQKAVADALADIQPTARPVTYAELTQLISSGGLIATNWYLLTDWRLTHTIDQTTVTYTSPREPLFLQATGAFSLATQGYSQVFPQDIIYYTPNNTARMPGATRGFIFRRIDTAERNDLEIDFRNVRFRRWQVPLAQPASDGATTAFISHVPVTGAPFQDVPMFEVYGNGTVAGNRWADFNQRLSTSVFGNCNFVQSGTAPVRNLTLSNTNLIGVTVRRGWFFNTQMLNCTLTNVAVVGTAFSTFLGGNIAGAGLWLNSSLTNRVITNDQSGSTVIASALTTQDLFQQTYINGQVYTPGGGAGGPAYTAGANIQISAQNQISVRARYAKMLYNFSGFTFQAGNNFIPLREIAPGSDSAMCDAANGWLIVPETGLYLVAAFTTFQPNSPNVFIEAKCSEFNPAGQDIQPIVVFNVPLMTVQSLWLGTGTGSQPAYLTAGNSIRLGFYAENADVRPRPEWVKCFASLTKIA